MSSSPSPDASGWSVFDWLKHYGIEILCLESNIVDIPATMGVNAANVFLRRGSGVCGAIYDKAGPRELHLATRGLNPPIPECCAVATPGFQTPWRYIAHVAAPDLRGRGATTWKDVRALGNAYASVFKVAADLEVQTIVFPALGTGAFGYSAAQGGEAAMLGLGSMVLSGKPAHLKRITFALLGLDVGEFKRGMVWPGH